ncbi:MAG: putative RNA methyltransferase [Methanomassiliicoccales archaeon PtaU1.Bin124]|nr:MAG: putative RNA methyltransferase [Methanomassiliicoccales archaeon PtaU1.Bin124]
MVSFRVVLVEPQNDGNVGAVARSMANFGFKELCMVSPCELTDEAYKRAKHAGDILRNANVVSSFEEAIKDCFLVVGTSAIITYGDGHFVRIPITPREFAEKSQGMEEKVALVFGREDIGLTQEQLLRCDVLINIPAHDDYPVLNLSHALTVVLYEIFALQGKPSNPQPCSLDEKELMFKYFSDLMKAIKYPEFRQEKTNVMFRRMMGRAVPTRWEYYTIMGVFGDAAKRITKLENGKESKDEEGD